MRTTRVNLQLILLSYLSLFYLGLLDNARGPVFPALLQELNLGDGQGAWFFALASLSSLFSAYGASRISHLVSIPRLILFGLVVLMTGAFGISLFTTQSSMWMSAAVFGFSFGVLNFGQNMAIHEGVESSRRRPFFVGLHAMYGASSLISPFLIGILLGSRWSWRQAWQLFIAFGVIMTIGIIITGWLSGYRKLKGERKESSLTDSGASQDKLTREDKKREKKRPEGMLLLGFSLGMAVTAEIIVSSRLSLYLVRTQGLGLAYASWVLSAFFLFMFIGRILFSFWTPPGLSNRRLIVISTLVSIVLIVVGLWLWPWALILVGLSMAPIYPTFMAYLADVFPVRLSEATGWAIALTSISIVLCHLGFGWVSAQLGLVWAMHLAALGMTISLFLLWCHASLARRSLL